MVLPGFSRVSRDSFRGICLPSEEKIMVYEVSKEKRRGIASSHKDESEGIFILTMNLIEWMMLILFNSLHKHLN